MSTKKNILSDSFVLDPRVLLDISYLSTYSDWRLIKFVLWIYDLLSKVVYCFRVLNLCLEAKIEFVDFILMNID
jgi:hypothetical protein